MPLPAIHRVVTGHDAQGNAIIASNGPLPVVTELQSIPGVVFHEVWETSSSPARVDNGADPTQHPLVLPPPKNGTRIRYVDIPPEDPQMLAKLDPHAGFAEIGDAGASTGKKAAAPHPLMHRTQTVDYGIVIEGEITLVVDQGEVVCKPGSVVVQRGTNHAWANRSGKLCRMLFILIDGEFEPGIAQALAKRG
jgi:mannose-6-phosphate isomerase-like protein (cupin superfamily)